MTCDRHEAALGLVKSGEESLDTKNRLNGKTPEPSAVKKPYAAPTLRFENVFEVSALSCGKLAGTSSTCNSVPKTS